MAVNTTQKHQLPNGKTININWQRSSRNRHIRLTVSAHGVRVSSPPRARWSTVAKFLDQQSTWLTEHLQKHQTQDSPNTLLFWGSDYKIQLGSGEQRVHLRGDTCFIHPVTASNDSLTQTLDRWLRTQAAEKITPLFLTYRQRMDIQAPLLKWRETKSRWGSCSSKGHIMLNWRLIHTPEEVARYVVIHELAHRVHHDHSKKFWSLVEKFDPAYKLHRGWLKRNGHRCQTPTVTIFS